MIKTELKNIFYIIRHPIDGFYEIRIGSSGVFGAILMFVMTYICQLIVIYTTNFVFNPFNVYTINPLNVALSIYLPLLVWMMANYLVSTISKGHGTLKHIFVATGYSLTPYVLFSVPIAILSLILTLEESAIYSFIQNGLYAWVVFMFYLQVKETHDFEVFETIKVILWILFTMLMIVIFAVALFAIASQSFAFVREVITEALGYA